MRPETETIWTNARIRTMDPARPFAHALLVRDGRIACVGEEGDIAAAAGPGARNAREVCIARSLLTNFVLPPERT